MINASDALAAALSAGGAISGLLAFLTGWRRENVTTERYRLYLEALSRRDQALASATPEGREAILREPPISQPPPLGAIALAALVAAGTGMSFGGSVVAVPQATTAIVVPAEGPRDRCSESTNCKGGRCVGGKCQKTAEEPLAPQSDVDPGLMTRQDPADLSLNEPPI